MSAHPMILPHLTREKEEALPTPEARQMFAILHDAVSAYAAESPEWEITRWLTEYDDALYACESRRLVRAGWRRHLSDQDMPPPFNFPATIAPATPGDARVTARRQIPLPVPPLDLGTVIAEMARQGVGRPSTYAMQAYKLLERNYVDSLENAVLTPKGRAALERLRSCPAARFDAAFTREFWQRLEALEAGRTSAGEILSWAVGTDEARELGQWLDGLAIDGDAAAQGYLLQASRDAERIAWRLPAALEALDPERQLPLDHPARARRQAINAQAAKAYGAAWAQLPDIERTRARIALLAQAEGCDAATWREAHRFDLLARWLVGWEPAPYTGPEAAWQ